MFTLLNQQLNGPISLCVAPCFQMCRTDNNLLMWSGAVDNMVLMQNLSTVLLAPTPLRFIHTSDWHLGQTLHGFDRTHEHQCFLDGLLDTLVTEQADALLVCGDIFDSANPSAASQRQLYHFLQQAKARVPQLQTVLIAGNHDSPGRLDAPGPLLETLDATVIGFIPRLPGGGIDVARLVLPLQNRQGDVAAWCIAVPFLRPGDVPRVETSGTVAEDDPYKAGIALLYSQALAHAQTLQQPGQALIALGHCHMVGGQTSEDSERRIVIGGTEALSAGLFDSAIAYAALGHLHLAQKVAGQDHLRYCGSPLPLSFAEVNYPHQVLRVDMQSVQAKTVTTITTLPVARAVDLLRVPSQPEPLAKVLLALDAMYFENHASVQRHPYLEVRVRLDAPEPGLRTHIEAALEGKAVRLAKIETSFASQASHNGVNPAPVSLDELERLQPEDIFQRLYRSKYQSESPLALTTAFAELLQHVEETATP